MKNIDKFLIDLGLKAIAFNPQIKGPYTVHFFFNSCKIPLNFLNFIFMVEQKGFIKKEFYSKENYTILLTEKGKEYAATINLKELLSRSIEVEYDKKKVLEFFSLTVDNL